MRCLVALIALLGITSVGRSAPAPAPTPIPPVLLEALKNTMTDEDHWAYTDANGGTSFRFDPSKPYPEQYTPIQVDGHPPTEKDLKEYHQRGVKRGDQIEKEIAAQQKLAAAPPKANLPKKSTDNEFNLSLDTEHITVLEETPRYITYSVPPKKGMFKLNGLSISNLIMTMRVDKVDHFMDQMSLKIGSPFRYMLIVKVTSGNFTVNFARPDSNFGALLGSIHMEGEGSVFFKKGKVSIDDTHSDFVRVTPYQERPTVTIGPLQALGF